MKRRDRKFDTGQQPLALSTGQAAKYCLVTADTIVNWIKHSDLRARRTVGGRYRILVTDLREYMFERGMDTDLLDAEHDRRCYCWEHKGGRGAMPMLGNSCADCLARRSRALNCFELRAALSSQHDDIEVCATCRYLGEWRQQLRCAAATRQTSDERASGQH